MTAPPPPASTVSSLGIDTDRARSLPARLTSDSLASTSSARVRAPMPNTSPTASGRSPGGRGTLCFGLWSWFSICAFSFASCWRPMSASTRTAFSASAAAAASA